LSFGKASCGIVDDLLKILFSAQDIEEFFGLKHVLDDGACVQVVLLCLFWAKLADEGRDSILLFFVDVLLEFWFEVRVKLGEELVENFRDRFLIDVFQELLNDG